MGIFKSSIQYLKDHQIAHAAFDSDDENSTLKRFRTEAEFINVNDTQEIDNRVRALEKAMWWWWAVVQLQPKSF